MTVGKVCNGKSKQHRDALAIVTFIFDEGGTTSLSNPDLAVELRFTTRHGSVIEVDRGRFHRARNHVQDRNWNTGKPCCGFRLHYRAVKGLPLLCLVDATGGIGDHAPAAAAALMGWDRVREST